MTRCAITCAEPGCNEKIFYETVDTEVHLYCWKHRSVDGRHSAVRQLKPAKPKNLYVCRYGK